MAVARWFSVALSLSIPLHPSLPPSFPLSLNCSSSSLLLHNLPRALPIETQVESGTSQRRVEPMLTSLNVDSTRQWQEGGRRSAAASLLGTPSSSQGLCPRNWYVLQTLRSPCMLKDLCSCVEGLCSRHPQLLPGPTSWELVFAPNP